MKLAVIGGGGREYAIIKRLSEDERITHIYALPGNGGISRYAECVPIAASDISAIVDFVIESGTDFVVITPDDPLALGLADRLHACNIPCFGPSKAAAELESSKSFAKGLMEKYGIPTAKSRSFDDMDEAISFASQNSCPQVIKADGLALGKGVTIARSHKEAEDAVTALMGKRCFGESGARILIEEYLVGHEVSVLTLTDGRDIVPLCSSMDHKAIGCGGTGPNTGGMGAIAPNPFFDDAMESECMERIFRPTVAAMNAEGRSFRGCLYFGLMLTAQGPKVIEYNSRFGDPETQAVLPLLEGRLLDIFTAVESGTLSRVHIGRKKGAVCCLVAASGGYPLEYKRGYPISMPDSFENGTELIHAGTALDGGVYKTTGGRVLNLVACADTLSEAVDRAYSSAQLVSFEGMYYRSDIGSEALAHLTAQGLQE